MLEAWDRAIITDISLAIYVTPASGRAIHRNRPFHGFVINDATSDKRIHFSDGTILHTGPNEFHYLPKGSDYQVESVTAGGCWAINFALLEDIAEKPFRISFRNPEPMFRLFKDAVAAWKGQSDLCDLIIRKILYDMIVRVKQEQRRSYLPSEKEQLIQPAVEAMHRDFTRNDLTVKALADLCRISEVYFRRIFTEKFSVSPKEYMITLRMDYAKRLLESGQFSVTEVAQLCGYFDPCHFSREFSRHTGLSPRAYSSRSNRH